MPYIRGCAQCGHTALITAPDLNRYGRHERWWFDEYGVDLGEPLGPDYQEGDAYYRGFEKGVVVAAPYSETAATLGTPHMDVASGETTTVLEIEAGDTRIYVAAG
jgi:hypothetical protein